MTAALHAVDSTPADGLLSAPDDDFSATDWKAKARELEKILSETRADLQDFQITSKQLEEELEQELDRTEKAQQELQVKVARAEHEKDEWKSKFMTLQTTHNTTTTSLQRELDTLRKDHQLIKVQLRELEMGNDDLERNERAISSSLADIEQKYARVLEEKILLEQDLYDKANLEEESQRLKDELRDANEEITVLKEQLTAAHDRAPAEIPPSVGPSSQYSDDEDYMSRRVSQDLQLSDLADAAVPAKDSDPTVTTAPRAVEHATSSVPSHSSILQRAGFQPRSALAISPSGIPSPLARSNTAPTSRITGRTPIPAPVFTRNVSNTSTTSTVAATRSRGVQMVSEMRARVKVLEQKIHTRVPRIRMGSVTVTNGAQNGGTAPPKAGPSGTTSPTASSSKSSLRSASPDKNNTVRLKRSSIDDKTRTPTADASGWVLIMEDSPSPMKEKEMRRASGQTAPSAFRPFTSASSSMPQSPTESRAPSSLSHSQLHTGIRRPQSRLSDGRSSISTNATTSTASSIPTPVSRPSTPTFLPIPTSGGLYHSTIGLKRPTVIPSPGAYSQPRPRPSLGASTGGTVRQTTKLGSPARNRQTSAPLLKKSGDDFSDAQLKQGRVRAGSATLLFGRHVSTTSTSTS